LFGRCPGVRGSVGPIVGVEIVSTKSGAAPCQAGPTTRHTVVHKDNVSGAGCGRCGCGVPTGARDSGGTGVGACGGAAGPGACGAAGAWACGGAAGAGACGAIGADLADRRVAVKVAAWSTIPVSMYCMCALKSRPLEQTRSSGTHKSMVLSAYNGPTVIDG
jgi:hypothetical protein